MSELDTADPGHVLERVNLSLGSFIADKRRLLADMGPGVEALADATASLASAGKRLRPAFFWWGWRGHGGSDCESAIRAAASLDLLHAAALIHDDLIDDSDMRRGRPSTHVWFSARHASAGWKGSPQAFGMAAAVLTGDLCLVWADEMFQTCGLDPVALDAGRPILHRMRTEVMAGQFLDVLTQAEGIADVDRALQVARLKTARYTVERPLQMGAALAGASEHDLHALGDYGIPLGVAFQLRDDLLGVFGDPSDTGKPSGDDLREGKQTVLLAITRKRANPRQKRVLDALVGKPDMNDSEADGVRQIMIATGARQLVEQMAASHAHDAVAAIGHLGLADPVSTALERAARQVVARTS